MMMMWILLKPDAAISACSRSRLVQVDINFGMSQGPTSSIANCFPTVNKSHRLFCNEGHGAQGIGLELHRRLLESWTFTTDRTGTLTGGPC